VENSVIRASSHQSSTFVHRTLAAQNALGSRFGGHALLLIDKRVRGGAVLYEKKTRVALLSEPFLTHVGCI
jgi:hypothetical protein